MRLESALCALFAVAATMGCSINAMYSENFPVLKQDVDYRAPSPLARRLTYVFATGSIVDNKPQLLIASNVSSLNDLNRRAIGGWSNLTGLDVASSAKAAILTSDRPRLDPSIASADDSQPQNLWDQSDLLSDEARVARAAGDNQGAELLTSQALVSARMAQVSQRFNDSIGMLNTYASTMTALSNLGKSLHTGDGAYFEEWVSTHTGVLGQEAPEGSVLHLDILRALRGDSFRFSSDSDLIVTATLEYADGRKLQSARGIQYVVDSKSDDVPVGFISAKDVPYTDEEAREIDGGDYVIPAYLHQFAVLIRSTIRDLYEQAR